MKRGLQGRSRALLIRGSPGGLLGEGGRTSDGPEVAWGGSLQAEPSASAKALNLRRWAHCGERNMVIYGFGVTAGGRICLRSRSLRAEGITASQAL